MKKTNLHLASIRWMCLAVLFLAGICGSVKASEQILEYRSDIQINADRTMSVRETITATAEGAAIKRGIYRDFPTDYKDRFGNHYRVRFEVISVKKDDIPEPYHTKRLSNGVRVYVGSKDVVLEAGTYRYEIHYVTDRQLGFFEDHDELYWNVTGNEWVFPIKTVIATVTLPVAVDPKMIETDGYTGPMGSRDKNFRVSVDARGVAKFETTDWLGAREGLTIVVGWPKGIIAEPTLGDKLRDTLADNLHLLFALLGALTLGAYYLFTWNKFGRDPESGVIVALYEPPPGYSPASMRYIEKMAYDKTCFTAAIINLAVKGFLTIAEDDNEYSLLKTGKKIELAPGESAITGRLFRYHDTVELKQSNHKLLSDTIDLHEQALSSDYENKYFKTNRVFFFIGIALSVVLVAGTAVLALNSNSAAEAGFFALWSTIWWFVTGGMLVKTWGSWKHSHGMASKISALIQGAFIAPFVAAGVFVLFQFGSAVNWPIVVFLLAVVALNVIFYQLLKAPTLLGRRLLDKVDGFRHYVDIAEKHELNYKNPAGKTPELFERYLPYALALGIEQKWSEQFDEVIRNANTGDSTYTPTWYSGSHWNPHNISGFTSAIGGSLGSAIASSSTAPGSSSGMGGGGSSGGGGGGGGGGGW